MRILVLCTGNSCRSQMAEGFLRHFDKSLEVYSAGTRPEKEVNPNAVRAMQEVGIDISSQHPKPVEQFLKMPFDYVITVCDHARETCPIFTGQVGQQLHIGFEDPAAAKGSEKEVMTVYRKVRDEIHREFKNFYESKIKRGE